MRRKFKNGIYTNQTIKSCRCKACMKFIRLALDENVWYTTRYIDMRDHNRPYQYCWTNSHGHIKKIFVKILHKERSRVIPGDFREIIKEKIYEKQQIVKQKLKNHIENINDSLDYYSYLKMHEHIGKGQRQGY